MNADIFKSLLIQAIKKSLLKMIVSFVVIVSITAMVVLLKDPTYQSSWTMLLPGTERSSTVNLDNIGEARTTTRNAYGNVSLSPKHTYKEIALSSAVINNAAEAFGVQSHSFSRPKIKLIQQTPAIKFTLKGANPEELIARAQIFNDSFHKVLDGLRANEIERHDLGVRQQLNQSQAHLDGAQQKIVMFKNTSNFLSEKQLQQRTSNLEDLRIQMVRTRIDLNKQKTKSTEIQRLLGLNAQQAITVSRLATHPSVVALLPEVEKTSSELAVLQATTGRNYPPRKMAENKMRVLTRELQHIVQKQPWLKAIKPLAIVDLFDPQHQPMLIELVDIKLELKTLESQLIALIEEIQALDESLREYAAEMAILGSLEREFQIAEAIFSSALTRLDSGKFDIYATYPLTQLLTLPGMNVVRDHMASKVFILAAFLIGMLLCLAFVAHHMRVILLESQRAQAILTEPVK